MAIVDLIRSMHLGKVASLLDGACNCTTIRESTAVNSARLYFLENVRQVMI